MADINELKILMERQAVQVEQHEREIQAIQASTAKMIQGQEKVTDSINGLTLSLQRYIDRHDSVAREQISQEADLRMLRDKYHENQPIIDGIRAIHGKLLLVVISALASPALILAMLTATTKGG